MEELEEKQSKLQISYKIYSLLMPIVAFVLMLIFTGVGTYTFEGDIIVNHRPYGVISDKISVIIYAAHCILCIVNFIFCSIIMKFEENRAPNFILMLSNIAVSFWCAIANEYSLVAVLGLVFLSPVFILGIIAWFITLMSFFMTIKNKFLIGLGYLFAILLVIYLMFIIINGIKLFNG